MVPGSHCALRRRLQSLAARRRGGALATAAALDSAAKNGGPTFTRGPLWGVPIVIKANTSVKGLVTSNGWKGYLIKGHSLICAGRRAHRRQAASIRCRDRRSDEHAGLRRGRHDL